jgi:DNA-binding beta-propeller fold protein YncE
MRTTERIVLTLSLLAGTLPGHAQTGWGVEKTMHIGGTGGFDYITADSQNHRLFVPRSTHTMVIDAESGKVLADIPGQKNAHGVAFVPQAGRGFITDGGGDGAIVVFDLKSYAVLGKLAAQPDADGIIYDPASGLILSVSGDKGVLMTFKPSIDPAAGKIDTPIELGGAPEFLAADGAGKAYINLEDKNEIAVVDLKARKVIARWPVAPGGAPVGMSLDTKGKRLFIGCRKPQKMIVISTETGKVISDMPIGDGVDATKVYGGQAFASTREGSLAVVAETSPGKFGVVQTVKTAYGAKTMDVDPVAHKIYLPTAEFEQPAAGSTGRPKAKPDTFQIIVVSRK